MENNQSNFLKKNKLSGLAYAEIIILVFCLLLHFVSWASISYSGKEVFSFVPFAIFGTDFIYIFAIFLLAAIQHFFGRFSGITWVVVSHMVFLVLLTVTTLNECIEAINQVSGLADFANGVSNMFGSVIGSRSNTSAMASITQSVNRFYIVVLFFIALLTICLLCSWIVSICRLASKDRGTLACGYYRGMLGYFVIGFIAFLYINFNYDININHNIIETIKNQTNPYVFVFAIVVFYTMLYMLLINAIVVGIVNLLHKQNKSMIGWSCALGGAFLVVFLILLKTIEVVSPTDLLDYLETPYKLDYVSIGEICEIGMWYMFRNLAFVAIVTCLLRTIYFLFFVPKETSPKETGTPKINGNYRRWLTISAIVLCILAIIFAVWMLLKGNRKLGNDLLPVQKPTWEKFMVLTDDEVSFYKEADVTSPRLERMVENIESDACAVYFKWSDVKTQKGFVSDPYTLSKDAVLPILEEQGGWYKVLVSDDEIGAQECYVQKAHGKEVKAEPITLKLLNTIKSYNWSDASFGLITKGDYENICFISVSSEMDGDWLDVGVLYDGVLINPLTRRIHTRPQEGWRYPFEVEEAYFPVLVYGDILLRDGQLDARVIEKEEELHQLSIRDLFEAIPPKSSDYQMESYYIPNVATDRFFTFITKVSGENNDAISEGYTEENLKDFTYMIAKTTDPEMEGSYTTYYSLYAKTSNGETISTKLDGYVKLEILDQGDYDGDGLMEAVVYSWGGGNAILPPYIVYYDSEEEEFKKAEGFEVLGEEPDIKVEQWKGKTSFVNQRGLRLDRYVYEDHMVTLVEQNSLYAGKQNSKVTVKELFGTREEPEYKTVCIDIDGDGVSEQVTFYHENAPYLNGGKDMVLNRIVWADGREVNEGLNCSGTSISFLVSTTNGMPDILANEQWLYKWNGEAYISQ